MTHRRTADASLSTGHAEWRIGVDGGGTKTECILIDRTGDVIARHVAEGSNPTVVGPARARATITRALDAVVRAAGACGRVVGTELYMAGPESFWQELAGSLESFGVVTTAPDSAPVLELATNGAPGLALHAGTGSFVTARGRDGAIHYAGGLGWRLGDPASGYDLGRRALSRALLELQGWAPPSALHQAVPEFLGQEPKAAVITPFVYSHPETNGLVASLAPLVLELAGKGDEQARRVVAESIAELIEIATDVMRTLFPGLPTASIPVGLSGRILNSAPARAELARQSTFRFVPVSDPPIEGVRRLLLRANQRSRG